MAARTVEIAQAVTDFMNDNPSAFDLAFTAERRTVPYAYVADITTVPTVLVSPAEHERTPESRASDQLTYGIAIHLFRAVDATSNTDSDEMVELCEDIMGLFSRQPMSGAKFTGSSFEQVLDAEAFRERSQFVAVIQLNYRD